MSQADNASTPVRAVSGNRRRSARGSAEALATSRRTIATRLAPAVTYANAIGTAGDLGETEVADSVLHQFTTDFPYSSELPLAAISLANVKQDFRAVDSIARILARGSALQQATAHQYFTTLAELGGRMADAAREQRLRLQIDESRGQITHKEAAVVAELADIARGADFATDTKTLERRLRQLWDQDSTITADRPMMFRRHYEFAMVFARLGDTTSARRLMDEFTSAVKERDYPAAGARLRTYLGLAAISTAAGRPDEALARIREGCGIAAGAFTACEQMAFLDVAEAHDRAGRADSAIAAYRRFVTMRGLRLIARPGSIDVVTPKLAPAWRRLGELLEAKGEKQQAIDAYERFLDYWRDADPNLQPIVRSVRERVTRLRRASG